MVIIQPNGTEKLILKGNSGASDKKDKGNNFSGGFPAGTSYRGAKRYVSYTFTRNYFSETNIIFEYSRASSTIGCSGHHRATLRSWWF